MIIEDIKNKWIEVINSDISDNYRAIRISAEGIPDLFIASNINGDRCLYSTRRFF